MSFFQLLALPILLALFLLPTILAIKKNHPHKLPIILVNIFGGLFMGVGWFVSLIWVLIKPAEQQSQLVISSAPATHHIADELTKLKKLMDDGVITEGDFEQRKKLLLAARTAT